MNDDEFEKLVRDLEARKDRDKWELAAWRSQRIAELAAAKQALDDRLGVESFSSAQDYRNLLQAIEAEYQERKEKNEARHQQIDKDIIAENLHHVWIDAKEEEKFEQAKRLWDYKCIKEIDYEKRHFMPSKSDQDEFEERYGPVIVQQLIANTEREISNYQKEKTAKEAERQERITLFEKQEQERLQAERRQAQQKDFETTADQVTQDKRPKPKIDNKIEEIKRQQQIDNADVQRIKEKNANPVDVKMPDFDEALRKAQQRHREEEEQERIDNLKRIEQDIKRAREAAQRTPEDRFHRARQEYEQNKDLTHRQGY